MENLKQTQLYGTHLKIGAKMVPFAGYLMPIQYTSIVEEHHAVRSSVGVFDVSHMGEFSVRGSQALSLLQKITTNDVSTLTKGKAQYSCFTNPNGGIIDDLIVYKLAEESYMLVVNASNIDKDWQHIYEHNKAFGADIANISDQYALLAVQGPKAVEAMKSLTSLNLQAIPYYTFEVGRFAGVDEVIISATGYTGAGGLEIYCKNQDVETIWNKIFEAGKAFGIKPIGLGARDTLRMEMGYCLYGNDIDDKTSPLEAGLGWVTKLNKDFVGSDKILEQKQKGILKKLISFVVKDRAIPRHGYRILNTSGAHIGSVTSGGHSPTLEKGIGMGYVDHAYSKPDTEIVLEIRDKHIKALVVKQPLQPLKTN